MIGLVGFTFLCSLGILLCMCPLLAIMFMKIVSNEKLDWKAYTVCGAIFILGISLLYYCYGSCPFARNLLHSFLL